MMGVINKNQIQHSRLKNQVSLSTASSPQKQLEQPILRKDNSEGLPSTTQKYSMIKKHPIHHRPETKLSEKRNHDKTKQSTKEDLNEFTFKHQGKGVDALGKTGMFGIDPVKIVDHA